MGLDNFLINMRTSPNTHTIYIYFITGKLVYFFWSHIEVYIYLSIADYHNMY